MDFRRDRVTALAQQVRSKELSATELTQHSLRMIEERNGDINAFVAVDAEKALEQAAAIDQIVASGGDPGPLAGIPIGVKDLEDAAGFRTTNGSPIFADAPPAPTDSILVGRLRQAGCVVIGKTNTPDFGWTARTENSLFGLTLNPWNREHSAGGSSGGSAAALAAGMVPLATGTDGGGSIRIPSAACGLSGMKSSFGRVPSGGSQPPNWLDLSTKGPMARSINDIAAALEVVVGPDQSDLSSLPRPEASWRDAVVDAHLPARVGWAPTLGYADVDREVLTACEHALVAFEELGVEVVEIEGPFEKDCVNEWLTIVGACLARSLSEHSEHPRYAELDETLQLIIQGGTHMSAIDLVNAFDASHFLNLKLVELFHSVRILVTPTMAGVAPPTNLGGNGLINGEETVNWVQMTYPFNMTHSPAATVCVGQSSTGVPIGIQLIGPQHADLVVLRAAAALEAALGFESVAAF
jgi:Asp-tRNA(Asn)/Glu-tRNA(Gln) amidotransferase A subunit family amidase